MHFLGPVQSLNLVHRDSKGNSPVKMIYTNCMFHDVDDGKIVHIYDIFYIHVGNTVHMCIFTGNFYVI